MIKLLSKLSYSFTTIFFALTMIFFVIRLSPGDPVEVLVGPNATQEEMLKVKEQLGLNLPISKQYFHFLTGFVKGELGQSIFSGKSVNALLSERLKPTMILAFLSIALSSMIGISWGTLAGIKKNDWFDSLSRVASLCFLALPIFSLSPLLVLIFSIKLKIFPVSEWGEVKHVFLPILTLVIPLSTVVMRVTRNKFLEEKNALWVTVVKSKGLSEVAISMRILKICLPTIFNVIAIQLSVVLAGTMITETLYDIPGMGSLLFEGIQNRDYPVVQGVIAYSTVVYLLIYFAVDYINQKIDPRIT